MCETADKEKKNCTPTLANENPTLENGARTKNKSWNIIYIQCETANMPDENLTEEIWWDLSYTFGFNIDEEKISWQNW